MTRRLQAALTVLFAAGATQSFAQCVNTIEPSCSAYRICFNHFCNCSSSESEYFLSFGEKYCQAFLSAKDFSEQGRKWRDSALTCLQETLVPLIPLQPNSSCDCKKIRDFATKSHVSCYADVSPSVCDLPLGDINKIGKTIVFDTSFIKVVRDRRAFVQQVKEVIDKCAASAIDKSRRDSWKFLAKLFEGKIN